MAREPILIVDDNAQNLKLAKVILSAEGYEVMTAIDAEEALRILESFVPRLILTDLQLPRMDGLELTRQLKADPARHEIIIIAGYANETIVRHGVLVEDTPFLQKPFTPLVLARKVRDVLESPPRPLGS
jgi:CheY-like chemotaxis protein